MKITKLICFLSVVSCSQQEKLIARNIAIPELAFKIEKEPQEELMGSFETRYKSLEPRSHNIEVASSKLKQTLAPGQNWKFNEVVGPRIELYGFVAAPTIFMGEIMPDVGGGVCQVSSTLHAAALFSGLEIVSRQPHTRASTYIERGLDATVAYSENCVKNKSNKDCYFVDLIIKNPYEFPVTLLAENKNSDTPEIKILKISILGKTIVKSTQYIFRVLKQSEYKRKVHKTSKYRLASYYRISQSGVLGIEGKSQVNLMLLDGTVIKKEYENSYRPVDEVWLVGLEYDLTGPKPWEEK